MIVAGEPSEPGHDPRHFATIEPTWNVVGRMPEARGADRKEQFDCTCCH